MTNYSSSSSVPWYSSRSSVKSAIIENGVTSIGEWVFCYCTSLTSITIPDSAISICNGAFFGCKSLTSITIPDSVTSIGERVFEECSRLIFITIPDGVTSIGDEAFYDCLRLESVTIGDGVTSIGDYAFFNCENLTSIAISDSVTSIGEWAFYDCSRLILITIPDSVTSIGYSAFVGCTRLTSVHITDISAWCNIEFNGDNSNPLCYAKNLYLNDELVTELVVPDGVISIGERAFEDCTSLASITIPNTVTSIGNYAFRDCTSLTSITIPDGITSIGYSTFYNCASDFTIYCFRDSYAMQYAVDNSLNYVIMDVGETENSIIDYSNNLIFLSKDGVTNLEDIIYAPATSTVSVQASLVSGDNEFLGTGSKIIVVDNGVSSEYTLIVTGDTNGDSVCDALDAAQVALVSNGHQTIDGAYKMAADSNADDEINIEDYQAIVNKVVA